MRLALAPDKPAADVAQEEPRLDEPAAHTAAAEPATEPVAETAAERAGEDGEDAELVGILARSEERLACSEQLDEEDELVPLGVVEEPEPVAPAAAPSPVTCPHCDATWDGYSQCPCE